MSIAASDVNKTGWNPVWEENVYSRGRHLNLYPYHAVVGFLLGKYGQTPNRTDIRVLELGFGAGNNLWFAAREGFSVAGVEGSRTAVEFARRRFRQEGLEGDLRLGTFAELDWPDESVDVVIDRASLSQSTYPVIEAALAESQRVLKPDGRLLSVIYSHAHPGRRFGECRGQNDYDKFSGGYFQGLGTAHFADRSEICELFGSRFEITALVHTHEDDMLDNVTPVNAFWRVECVKN